MYDLELINAERRRKGKGPITAAEAERIARRRTQDNDPAFTLADALIAYTIGAALSAPVETVTEERHHPFQPGGGTTGGGGASGSWDSSPSPPADTTSYSDSSSSSSSSSDSSGGSFSSE